MSEQRPTRILLVEDSPGDARLVEILLGEGAPAHTFHLDHVENLGDALGRLGDTTYDVVLLDLSLPDSHGLDTLNAVLTAAPRLPIVVLTGTADNEVALKAVHSGAQDYLVKGEGDGRTIHRALSYAIERTRAEEALRDSEARFRALFKDAAIGIMLSTPDGSGVEANPALAAMLGCAPADLEGVSLLSHAHAEDHAEHGRLCRELCQGGREKFSLETRFVRADNGETVWGRLNASLVRDAHDQPLYVIELVEDVTERREMEARLRLSNSVFENTSEGIFVTDAERRIVHVNPAFTVLTGYPAEEATGQAPDFLSSGRHEADFFPRMWQVLDDQGQWRGEVWNRRKSGELFAAWLNIAGGAVTNYVAVFSDITARKQAEERLAYLANHDPLTNLANRILFTERLNRAIVRARRLDQLVGVLFVDLDGFKEVNDEHGHAVGDGILQQVAERLRNAARPGDTVGRLAGDEFTVILEDLDHFGDAAAVAENLIESLSEPYTADVAGGMVGGIGASVGISTFPDAGEDATSLVKAADRAMFRAKHAGPNHYRYFSEEMNTLTVDRNTLLRDLRNALEEEEFRVFYQPRVDVASGRVVGVEALCRWQRHGVGLLPPGQFLDAAEDEGLISDVDYLVLRRACHQLRAWRNNGAPVPMLTVNLSAQTLLSTRLTETIRTLLADTELEPGVLEVEVKEADLMSGGRTANERLEALREMGVRVSIDDFGTGYSAFGMLRQLPITALTIAGSFIRNVASETGDAQIVTAITALAHSLHLTVVAKGVETDQHVAFLKHHDIGVAQGFLFSRPLSARDMTRLLEGGDPLLTADESGG